MQHDLGNLQRFVPRKPGETRDWRVRVTHALLGKKCVACMLLEVCYTVQRQSYVATIVKKTTEFYFVQRCALQVAELPCYTVQF